MACSPFDWGSRNGADWELSLQKNIAFVLRQKLSSLLRGISNVLINEAVLNDKRECKCFGDQINRLDTKNKKCSPQSSNLFLHCKLDLSLLFEE